MKIGFIIKYFKPFIGGAENVAYYIAKELAKNHEVHVFTSDQKEAKTLKKEEVIDNIHIHRCKVHSYRYHLTFSPEMLKKVLKTKLDVLHIYSLGFIWNDTIALFKKISSKTKIYLTPHGPFMTLKKYTPLQYMIKLKITFIEFFINKIYTNVFQDNPYQHEWMTKAGINKNKIKLLPLGIPKEYLKQRKPLPQYKNKFVISYVGRIQKYKGLDQIIKVLPNFPNVIFLAAGPLDDGYLEYKKLAKKLNVEKQVIFLGKIPEEKLLQVYATSKIFVLPSEWEAFGLVQLEAMSQGNAIVATKTEGSRYLIKKENGFLYDFNDLQQLKNHLSTLIKNKKLLNEIIKNNKEKVKNFTWNIQAKKLEKIYQEK